MKTKVYLFVALLFCVVSVVNIAGQNPTPTQAPQVQSSSATQTGKEKSDDDKQEQAKVYQEMFDKLVDRATWLFGVIGGIVLLIGSVIAWLVKWTLKETREDAKKVFETELERRGLSELNDLQKQVSAFNSFKDRRIDWILPSSVPEPKKEIAFLERAGLKHVSPIAVTAKQKAVMLNNPDLVILSFDGTEQSKELVDLLVGLLKQSRKEIPVLIYAPLGLRIPDNELNLLSETALHASANFPATLVTQALELVRLRQSC